MKARTAQCNRIHGFLLEYGIESSKGIGAVSRRLPEVLEDAENEVPFDARGLPRELGGELRRLDDRVKEFDARIGEIARRTPACRRLQAIPGVGPLTATALAATVGSAAEFRNGRELAAWLGLVPRQRATGGKPTLPGISKRGDRHLRTLMIHGARAALRTAAKRDDRRSRWALEPQGRRGANVAAVALANKNARPRGRCWPARPTSTPTTSARRPEGGLKAARGRESFPRRLQAADGCSGVKLEVLARQVEPARQEPAQGKGLRDRAIDEAGVCGTHQGPGAPLPTGGRIHVSNRTFLGHRRQLTPLQTRGGPYMPCVVVAAPATVSLFVLR